MFLASCQIGAKDRGADEEVLDNRYHKLPPIAGGSVLWKHGAVIWLRNPIIGLLSQVHGLCCPQKARLLPGYLEPLLLCR